MVVYNRNGTFVTFHFRFVDRLGRWHSYDGIRDNLSSVGQRQKRRSTLTHSVDNAAELLHRDAKRPNDF